LAYAGAWGRACGAPTPSSGARRRAPRSKMGPNGSARARIPRGPAPAGPRARCRGPPSAHGRRGRRARHTSAKKTRGRPRPAASPPRRRQRARRPSGASAGPAICRLPPRLRGRRAERGRRQRSAAALPRRGLVPSRRCRRRRHRARDTPPPLQRRSGDRTTASRLTMPRRPRGCGGSLRQGGLWRRTMTAFCTGERWQVSTRTRAPAHSTAHGGLCAGEKALRAAQDLPAFNPTPLPRCSDAGMPVASGSNTGQASALASAHRFCLRLRVDANVG
jgi:hypothetical protein